MKKNLLSTALLITTLVPAIAHAKDASLIAFSIGYYDVLDDQDGADFRIEYRPAKSMLTDHLKPWAGLELTSQGSLWAGGGLLYDWKLNDQWSLTPSFGAGLYAKGGSDIDLDFPVQFRTQLELSYGFKEESRLGINLSHMSNAKLGDSNPGTEVISLIWSMPLNKIF